jgi:hypothetical protein
LAEEELFNRDLGFRIKRDRVERRVFAYQNGRIRCASVVRAGRRENEALHTTPGSRLVKLDRSVQVHTPSELRLRATCRVADNRGKVNYGIAVRDGSGWIVSNVAANELEILVARELGEGFATRAQTVKDTHSPATGQQLSHED